MPRFTSLASLRNLITPHAGRSLLRCRLGVIQWNARSRRLLQTGNSPLSLPTSSTRLNATHASSSSSPTSISRKESTASSSNSSSDSSLPANTSSVPLPQQIEPRLSLTFTCTVSDCGERSTHQFTKRAYQKGIVLVQCPGCKNRYVSTLFLRYSEQRIQILSIRHLIADHLGWFKESTQDGKLRTVEDLLKAKGEKVQRGRLDVDGTVEYIE